MLKINKKQSFTLIELLVSLGIISIVILLVVGIYVYVIGSREKTLGQTDLQQEGQFVINLLTKDIRGSKIDYSAYAQPIVSPTGELILTDIDEEVCIFYRRQTVDSNGYIQRCVKNKTELTQSCSYVSNTCQDEDYEDLTSSKLSVLSLNFYVYPDEDPFDESSSSFAQKQQPRVTITFEVEPTEEKAKGNNIFFQQTVLQRWTKRE
ncbi:type II secretion system protein [bacterium]|nr:type II secretion system protein [bacterium]